MIDANKTDNGKANGTQLADAYNTNSRIMFPF